MSDSGASVTSEASTAPGTDWAAMVEAWRARGDDRFDPVRFCFIEALARRAAAHHGDVRRLLDDKVARLLGVYGEDLARVRSAQDSAGNAGAPAPSALAKLVVHLARSASSRDDGAQLNEATPAPAFPAEPSSLAYFRDTWSRLSAERRLAQSLAKVPGNAGPLHSHHLVHRALTLMRDVSPQYLHRFMAYVDALSWLDQTQGGSGTAAKGLPGARERAPRQA